MFLLAVWKSCHSSEEKQFECLKKPGARRAIGKNRWLRVKSEVFLSYPTFSFVMMMQSPSLICLVNRKRTIGPFLTQIRRFRWKPHDEHGHSASCWDACVLVQRGAAPDTIMGENLRTIDDAVAEAKQFANVGEPSQCPGLVGRCNHDKARHIMDRFHGTRAGNARNERVNTWCRERNFDRGIESSENIASLYKTQRANQYHGFDETQPGNCIKMEPAEQPPRCCSGPSLERVLATSSWNYIFEVLTEFVEHTLTVLTHLNKDSWDTTTTDQPTGMRAKTMLSTSWRTWVLTRFCNTWMG